MVSYSPVECEIRVIVDCFNKHQVRTLKNLGINIYISMHYSVP